MNIKPGDKFYKYTILELDHYSQKIKKNIYKCKSDDDCIILIREDFLSNNIDSSNKSLEFDCHYSDIINKNDFKYLIPISFDHYEPASKDYPYRRDFYRCKCTRCNREELILLTRRQLIIEKKTDCGCSYNDLTNIPKGFYHSYHHMKGRCDRKNDKRYNCYGKRGITYCDRWKDFQNFVDDMLDEYLNHSKLYGEHNTTLERINVNEGYYKENCCWITKSEQASNKQNTYYFTLLGEDKKYTINQLLQNFADPTLTYSRLRQRLIESTKYCKDGNIFNPDVFIDYQYRMLLYKPVYIKDQKPKCPIKIIDKNKCEQYINMNLPTSFNMKSYNKNMPIE